MPNETIELMREHYKLAKEATARDKRIYHIDHALKFGIPKTTASRLCLEWAKDSGNVETIDFYVSKAVELGQRVLAFKTLREMRGQLNGDSSQLSNYCNRRLDEILEEMTPREKGQYVLSWQ